MPKNKTYLDRIKGIRVFNIKNGSDEILLIAYCIALEIITSDDAKKCQKMESKEFRKYIIEKRDLKIKELENEIT